MARHALAQEAKDARRDGVLSAALGLFLEDTRRFPAVAAIAARAGLAKGTVYLYFRTKEEIFAALLSHQWQGLFSEVQASFECLADSQSRVAIFIDRFVTFLDSHPYFLRLDSLAYALLEAELPREDFWRFKQQFASQLGAVSDAVDAGLALPSGRGFQLLVRSYALARGLWQTLDFPDHLRGDQRFTDLPLAQIRFADELASALSEYWAGALA